MSTQQTSKAKSRAAPVERDDADAAAIIERLKKAVGVNEDAELAELLRVSRTTISNWRARNSVPLKRLRPLCAQLGVPMDYLVTGRIGVDRYVDAPLDSEVLGYIFALLARYGFIRLPKAKPGYDPARRAAAEFVMLQRDTIRLMKQSMDAERLTADEAKRAILARPSEVRTRKGPQ